MFGVGGSKGGWKVYVKYHGRMACFLMSLTLVFLPACGITRANAGEGESPPGSSGVREETTNSDNADAGNADAGKKRESVASVLIPEAIGQSVIGTDTVAVDISNVSDGYVMASYTGTASDCKMQLTVPDGTVYTFTVPSNDYGVFPLSGGNGKYGFELLEHVQGKSYAVIHSGDFDVSLKDEYTPFLYPNQYVWYTRDMKTVRQAEELSDQSADDLDFVGRVYDYVTHHIVYDEAFAASAPVNYIPDVDEVLESGKGICMDYAALMTAMLRSQGVPAKMDIGYSGDAYHAWLSVYIKDKGWVDDVIYFDGSNWSLMDPTIAASNSSSAVKKYVGDGTNYVVKYCY